MTFELLLKIIANGLFFTPKAVISDVGGVMTMFIYFVNQPRLPNMDAPSRRNQLIRSTSNDIPSNEASSYLYSSATYQKSCTGIFPRVTILMIVVMFIFASFGVQIVGGKLAACNDPTVLSRVCYPFNLPVTQKMFFPQENCTGIFWQKIFVTRLEVYGKNDEEMHPKILVPRVWTNPRNFNFDHVGNAMLALFETLSYKGWNVIRDILYSRQGP
ncbi:unnamed protein product, partial [Cylicostephanus goldi]